MKDVYFCKNKEPLADVLEEDVLVSLKEKQYQWFYRRPKPLSLAQRLLLLKSLQMNIVKYEDAILEALKQDLGKHKVESYVGEVAIVYEELRTHIRNLMWWAKPKRVRSPFSIFPAKSRIYKEPYGNVLIFSPWNYPLQLSLVPLIGAISAGNTVVLKPSEYCPCTSKVLHKLIADTFVSEIATVVLGGVATSEMLMELKWDKVFFTGSTKVAKTVMAKCAETLTPVTLELGGKSPVILNDTSNMSVCADRIVFGKTSNGGQVCVAPDYILVKENLFFDFVNSFKHSVDKMFPGNNMGRFSQMSSIVTEKAFYSILDKLDESRVLLGGNVDEDNLKIEPTLIDGGRVGNIEKTPFMESEVFAPVLPVVTYKTIEEAMSFIMERPKPLALYLFTESRKIEKKVLSRVSFGGGCINDTLIHLANHRLPFGGVGESGMGSYHGRKTFDTFSHEKSIVKKGQKIDIPLRYMPFTEKKYAIIRKLMK